MSKFVTLTQSAHPSRDFEDPALIDGHLARRGAGPLNLSAYAAEAGILDPDLLAHAGPDSETFDGWADSANWVNFVEYKDEWAPHLTGVITCKTRHERLIFGDGLAQLVEGQVVYPRPTALQDSQAWVFQTLEAGITACEWDIYAQAELLAQFIEEQTDQDRLKEAFTAFVDQQIKNHEDN